MILYLSHILLIKKCTLLSFSPKIRIIKRNSQSGVASKKALEALGKGILTVPIKNTNYHYRSASTKAGRFGPHSDIKKNPVSDTGQKLQGDVSGHHLSVVTTVCKDPLCSQMNCANPNNINPCGISSSVHTQALPHQVSIGLIHEMGQTLTHKVPGNLQGVLVDPKADINVPHSNGQWVVVEKNVRTLTNNDVNSFIEDKKGSTFTQENIHSKILTTNMPQDSLLK